MPLPAAIGGRGLRREQFRGFWPEPLERPVFDEETPSWDIQEDFQHCVDA
jgi:hypothetical protein